jgi:hypothetical protein
MAKFTRTLLITLLLLLCVRPFIPNVDTRTEKQRDLDEYLILRESIWICEEWIFKSERDQDPHSVVWWSNAHSETSRRLRVVEERIHKRGDPLPQWREF